MFTVNNLDNFQTNSVVHRMNARAKHRMHQPTLNLSCIQKSVFYSGIKTFNSLPPPHVVKLKQEKPKFKAAGREYFIAHPFYSLVSSEFLYTSQINFSLQHH